jgi:hypothetical protein
VPFFSSPILKVFFYYITTIIKKQLNASDFKVTILLQQSRSEAERQEIITLAICVNDIPRYAAISS